MKIKLPDNFIFGTAAASFQIEGSVSADGKGPSIWDAFTHRKGTIKTGENADTACDHYKRYRQDIGLMKELGLEAYRGSIAWPRILPEGDGRINEAGLDFYDRMTDTLLEAGITPYWTLFHWDLPLALQKRFRGFQSREIVPLFGDYVETVVNRLGDRAKNWITLNEPWEFAGMGHLMGAHAPGIKNPGAFFRVMHHQLLAHGEAARRIRSISPDAEVGITVSLTPVHPKTDRKKDIQAASVANEFMNHITLQPLLTGTYPEELFRRAGFLKPKIRTGDMKSICQPVDFLGVNNYQREWASHKWYVPFFRFWITGAEGKQRKDKIKGAEYTAMGWEVYPESMYESIQMVRQHKPDQRILVTETGLAREDAPTDGKVADMQRIRFLEKMMYQIHRSRKDGARVDGIFPWSFMDNFEWAEGFRPRFGLVYVDYKTQKRIPKESAKWYSRVIRERGFDFTA